VTGLVDDGEPEALDLGAGDLGQPLAERTVVVVAADRQQPPGPGLELVEEGGVDPVAGMDDDVRRLDRGPQITR
jgi:hypothetical protein